MRRKLSLTTCWVKDWKACYSATAHPRKTVRELLFFFLLKVAGVLGDTGVGQRWPFRPAFQLCLSALNPGSAVTHGHVLKLDPHDALRLSIDPIYEPLSTRVFAERIRPGDTVLDVGANIGYYALIAAQKAGPVGRVIAVEPDPENYALLRHNIHINGYDHVQPVCAAIADRCGEADLWKAGRNWGGHSLFSDRKKSARVRVKTTTIDAYLESVPGDVHFIKMDIEGAEPLALAGMRRTLERCRAVSIMSEIAPSALRAADQSPMTYAENLQGHGFVISIVDETSTRLQPASASTISERCNRSSQPFNILCTRG